MSDLTEICDRTPSPNTQNTIRIKGARQHNLKNIDLELPRDACRRLRQRYHENS